MKKTEYIIVGDGYAALFFAHQLLKENKEFVIFSEGKKSASQISAGMINPVVLKRFTSFWLAKEQIDFLNQTLSEIKQYTGKNYLIKHPIQRIFHNEEERELWKKKMQEETLRDFLHPVFEDLNIVKNPYSSGRVNHSARLNVKAFFEDLLKYFHRNGYLKREKFDYSQLNVEDSRYIDIEYKHIVFAEGISVKQNPYFQGIPIHINKGHHLEVQLSTPLDVEFTIKKKHFIFPLENGNYYYGGTYDRERTDSNVDEEAKNQLIEGLSQFYPEKFSVENVNLGFRPTVKDRRPILGKHKDYNNLYVFNGLGARGILNGCYFSKELFDFIEHKKPLMPEVDLKRFSE
ncbi:MAG: FAD-dependent oxidoreductase [Flavobacteriaceae bacterium]|nr:FAD-dependent oxidoreductase [Flavobacteriaceae bacterium]